VKRRLVLGLAAVLLGCPKESLPPAPEPGKAPLDDALALWELEALSLPAACEAGYSEPTAWGLVDAARAHPLAVPRFADELGAALDATTTASAVLAALAPVAPLATPTEAPPSAARRRGPAPLPSVLLASPRGKLMTEHLPASFLEPMTRLLLLLEELDAEADRWHGGVGPIRRPTWAAAELFEDADGAGGRYRSHPTGVARDFADAFGWIDQAAMHDAAGRLLAAVEAELPALHAAVEELPPSDGLLLDLDTRLGRVVVGSTGGDDHGGDAVLLIDPAGDDRWQNNAGSHVGQPGAAALALDLSGRDRYVGERMHTQGDAYGGISVLVDAGAWPDEYVSAGHGQGSAIGGVGILWDQGGNDRYQITGFGQGAAAFGTGLLIDDSGDDTMTGSSRAQGFAGTFGLGAMIDRSGNDQRRIGSPGVSPQELNSGGGQGAAWGTRPVPWDGDVSLHGGVGLAYDGAGDDVWLARAWAQGQAWFLSLGLLLDRGGNDRYLVEMHGQGSASHLAVGALVDSGGDDRYESGASGTAFADDRAAGLLWDRGRGHDTYIHGSVGSILRRELGPGLASAQGPSAAAILVDDGGDDRWSSIGDGLGWALPAARPDQEPVAALLDLGGADRYDLGTARPGGAPADGATWLHAWRGIGRDLDVGGAGWRGGLTGGGPTYKAAPIACAPEPPAALDSPDAGARWRALRAEYDEAAVAGTVVPAADAIADLALNDPHPAVRRMAARRLVAAGDPRGVDVLVDSLSFQSADNDPRRAGGSIVHWLRALLNRDHGFEAPRWRQAWQGMEPDVDLAARWTGLAALERAATAASQRDVATVLLHCDTALAAMPGEVAPRARCAAMAGLLAWSWGHPDAAQRDAAQAQSAARYALGLQPDEPRHFVAMAHAQAALGDLDGARNSVDKAFLLDPDLPAVVALRRRLAR